MAMDSRDVGMASLAAGQWSTSQVLIHGREIEVIPALGEFAVFDAGHAQAGELYRLLFASIRCRENRRNSQAATSRSLTVIECFTSM